MLSLLTLSDKYMVLTNFSEGETLDPGGGGGAEGWKGKHFACSDSAYSLRVLKEQ